MLIGEIPSSLKNLRMQGLARRFPRKFLGPSKAFSYNISVMLDVHRVNFPAYKIRGVELLGHVDGYVISAGFRQVLSS